MSTQELARLGIRKLMPFNEKRGTSVELVRQKTSVAPMAHISRPGRLSAMSLWAMPALVAKIPSAPSRSEQLASAANVECEVCEWGDDEAGCAIHPL